MVDQFSEDIAYLIYWVHCYAV